MSGPPSSAWPAASRDLLSGQVRFTGDPARAAADTAGLRAAGAGLAIIYLPVPHTPAVLEPLASALAQLD